LLAEKQGLQKKSIRQAVMGTASFSVEGTILLY